MVDYEKLGLAELKKLVAERGVVVEGDSRQRSAHVLALRNADEVARMREERARRDKELSEKAEGERSELEKRLAKKVPDQSVLRVWGDVSANRNRIDESFRVRNLPADFVHGWASMSIAGGEDIGTWTSLGWIRAEARDCTNDPSDTSKIYVPNYEEYNGFVRNRDCLLMLANRRVVERRKDETKAAWNARVERTFGPRDSNAVRRDVTMSDEGFEFRRTTQWRPEEGLKEGS